MEAKDVIIDKEGLKNEADRRKGRRLERDRNYGLHELYGKKRKNAFGANMRGVQTFKRNKCRKINYPLDEVTRGVLTRNSAVF